VSLPIRVRLALWTAGLLAAIISALGAFLVLQLKQDLRQAIDEDAKDTSAVILQAVRGDGPDKDSEQGERRELDVEDFRDAAAAGLPPSGMAQVVAASGEVRAAFGSTAGREPLLPIRTLEAARPADMLTFSAQLGTDGQAYRVEVIPYRTAGEQHYLVVGLSLQPVEDAVRRVLVLLLVAGPAALLASAFAAYWLSRKALRPVERMASDAQEIGTDRLYERVEVPTARDELGHLAVTLNAMLDRIERGVIDKRRLVADASHALRTPLAVMRAELDVSLRGDDLSPAAREVLESAREEVDRMARTVDNLIALAQTDEGRLELLTVPVDLRRAVHESAQPLRLLASANDVSMVLEGEPEQALADPQRLQLALTNLIENALKFSPPGSTVTVSSWRRDGEVGVTVRDEGPGIPEADREHLFDRYYRAGSARARNLSGSGLGLAICREVAIAHGGRIWVDSTVGEGSAFTLALPRWRALGLDSGPEDIDEVPDEGLFAPTV
jgi:heavy metal sensor kinase